VEVCNQISIETKESQRSDVVLHGTWPEKHLAHGRSL
jgi:hypothetical protein